VHCSPELWGNSHKIYDFLFLSRLFSIGKQIHPHLFPPPSKGEEKGWCPPVKREYRKVGVLDKGTRKRIFELTTEGNA
jgi:hypothetical protein